MFAALLPGLIIVALTIVAIRLVFGFLMRPAGFKRPPRKNFRISTRIVRALAYIVSQVAHRLR
jgi:high-affinity Fe2+/Pb2+ permease